MHNLAAAVAEDAQVAERLEAAVPALVNLLSNQDPRADAKLHAVAALRGMAAKVGEGRWQGLGDGGKGWEAVVNVGGGGNGWWVVVMVGGLW